MKKTNLFFVYGLIALLIIGTVTIYNSIVSKQQNVEEAWSNIETTLQRRYDLIPNLVSTVKGYAKHEKETFDSVVKARSEAMSTSINLNLSDPVALQNLMQMQGTLSGALSRLIAVAEAYPELKASKNFLDLQSQLEGTENRINVARTRYNKAAKDFNAYILRFPNNIINNILAGFPKFEYFQANEEAQKTPIVSFE